MNVHEMHKILKNEGEFKLHEFEDVLAVVLHEFDAQLWRTLRWDVVAEMTEDDVIDLSTEMWSDLYNCTREA